MAALPPIVARTHVRNPVRLSGSAEIWEASFQLEVRRDHHVLSTQTVTADRGAPGRGSWRVDLDLPVGKVAVRLQSIDEETGLPVNIVDVLYDVEE